MKGPARAAVVGVAIAAVLTAAAATRGSEAAPTPGPDYLRRVRNFADCMILHGRDRYGNVHSPLFATSLLRQARPELVPYPEFAKDVKPDGTVVWQFQATLNWGDVRSVGGEKAHKQTWVGADPLESAGLYRTLYGLSRLTGDPRYRAEADAALAWFFAHTQSRATGLFPWGEHLGWDFRYECPSYEKGPMQGLYAFQYEEASEPYDFCFDALFAAPAAEAGGPTPGERFARGLWATHVWDKEKGWFCRHGDYYGRDDRRGSDAAFPKYLGRWFDLWSRACAASGRAEFRREVVGYIDVLVRGHTERSLRWGYMPFTLADVLTPGGKPGDFEDQALEMGWGACRAARRLERDHPDLAARLRRLADIQFDYYEKHPRGAGVRRLRLVAEATGRPAFRDAWRQTLDSMTAADAAQHKNPGQSAAYILEMLHGHRQFSDPAYLAAAARAGSVAVRRFMDETCPLPKCAAGPLLGPRGPVEPFYHAHLGSDDLMEALLALAEATKEK